MAPRCHLLGGSFASAIQACLAVVCVGTLIVKRHYEHPRRDWMVWFLDVLKQGCGSSVGHFANIYLSQVIAYTIRDADECQWYCFTYLVDCTLGITMNVFFLRLFERAVDRYPLTCRIMKFGDYGDPPQLHYFVMQLVAWVSIVVTVKAIILSLMLHVLLPINGFIAYLFTAFEGHARLELVMVMVIIPTVLNTLAFWVTDTFLKRQFGFSEHMPLRTEDDDGDDDDFDRHLVDEMNLELTIVSDKSNPPSFPKSPKVRNGSIWSSHSDALKAVFKYTGLQFVWSVLFSPSRTSRTPRGSATATSLHVATHTSPLPSRRPHTPHSHRNSAVHDGMELTARSDLRDKPEDSSSIHSRHSKDETC